MGEPNKPVRRALGLLIAARQYCGSLRIRLARRFPALRPGPATGGTRGDVPGWVLITLMSAVLVAGLLAIAGPALEKLFTEAMSQVQP